MWHLLLIFFLITYGNSNNQQCPTLPSTVVVNYDDERSFQLSLQHPILKAEDGLVPGVIYTVSVSVTGEHYFSGFLVTVTDGNGSYEGEFMKDAPYKLNLNQSLSENFDHLNFRFCNQPKAIAWLHPSDDYVVSSVTLKWKMTRGQRFNVTAFIYEKGTWYRKSVAFFHSEGCVRSISSAHGLISELDLIIGTESCSETIISFNVDAFHHRIIQFQSLNMRDDCSRDYVEVLWSLGASTDWKVHRICAQIDSRSLARLHFLSYQEPIIIRGKLDDESRFKAIHYTLDRRKGCNATLTTPTGAISSPNYPKSYFPGLDCYIHFKVDKDQRAVIQLKFLQLHQRSDGSCSADYVQLMTSGGRIGRKYCGSNVQRYPHQYLTMFTSEDFIVHFHSDWLGGGKGFLMEYAVSTACGKELHTTSENVLFLLKEDTKSKTSESEWDHCFTTVHVPFGFIIRLNVTLSTENADEQDNLMLISQLAPSFHQIQGTSGDIINAEWSGCSQGILEVIEKDSSWVLCNVNSWNNVTHLSRSNHLLVRLIRNRSEKLRKPIVISYTAVATDRTNEKCSYGWSSKHDSCYLLVRKRLSWIDAENYCQQLDGHLVSIPSYDVQLFLNRLIEHSLLDDETAGIWTGGNDRGCENCYEWSNGQPMVFNNWFKGWALYGFYGWQPNDDGLSNQDCVEMRKMFMNPTKGLGKTEGFFWNDRDCSIQNPFICETASIVKTALPVKTALRNCNQTIKLTIIHPVRKLTSPLFPNSYPSDADCKYWISSPIGTRISISFDNFYLEDGPSCEYDYLELVNDGKVSRRVCGDWKTKIKLLRHVSISNNLQIHFVSDHSHGFPGFQAQVSIEEGGETCEHERMIRHGRNCYLIVPHPLVTWATAQQICSEMKAWLADVATKEEKMFILNHLTPFTPSVYPSGMSFWVGKFKLQSSDVTTLKSSSTSNFAGFAETERQPICSAFVRSHEEFESRSGTCDDFRGYICQKAVKDDEIELNKTLRGDGGVVTSPNYPSNYPNNVDYTLKLIGQPWTRIVLTLNFIEIEWQKDCLYDYLGLRNSEDEEIIRLCGTEGQKDDQWRFVSTYNTLFLSFHSDYSIVSSGFSASWKALDVSGCPIKTLRSSAAILTSPNYPEPYLDSMNCKTVVITGVPNKWIFLQFNAFWVGTGRGGSLEGEICYDDQLVLDLKDNEAQLSLSLCGKLDSHLPNLAFLAYTSQFQLSFTSGHQSKANGYEATFTTVDGTSIERVVQMNSRTTGRFFHLNYPYRPPPNLIYKRKLILPLTYIFNLHLEGYSPATGFNDTRCDSWSIEIQDPYGESKKLCKSDNESVAEEFLYKSKFNIIVLHEITGYSDFSFDGYYQILYSSVKDPLFQTKSMEETLQIESCDPNPCINGGSCSVSKNLDQCICHGHFTGTFCHLTMCDLNPCIHGTCNLTSIGYQCHCQSGYNGQRCDNRINPCLPNPCGTRGICYPDNKGSFHCRCNIWWQGPLCESKAAHIPYKPLSQRMLEEPFWLGLITVFSVLAFLGFVWCIKRKFADKIERFLTEELDKSQKGGKKHSLRDGGSPISLSPHLGPKSLLGRIGLRKHSMLSLDSSESISPNCHENRSFSLADIGRKSDSQKRLDKLKIQHSESSPAPLDKKELLQSLVTPTSARSRRMSLDEFFQMSERKILERNNSRGDNMSDYDSGSNEETSLDSGLRGNLRRAHFVRTLEKIDSVSFENERDEEVHISIPDYGSGCSSKEVDKHVQVLIKEEHAATVPQKIDYSDGSSIEVESCGSYEVATAKAEVFVEVHATPKQFSRDSEKALMQNMKLTDDLKLNSRIAPPKIITVNRSEISSPVLNFKSPSWNRPGSPVANQIPTSFELPRIEVTNQSISPRRKMFHCAPKTGSLDFPKPLITITANTSSCESDIDSPVKTQIQMNYLSPFDILRQDSSERSTSLSNLSSSGYSSMTSPGPSRCNSNSPLLYAENDGSPAHMGLVLHPPSPRHMGIAVTKTIPLTQVRPPLQRAAAVVRKRSDSETTDEQPEASLPDSDEGIGMDHIDVKIHRGELTSAKDLALYMDYRQSDVAESGGRSKIDGIEIGGQDEGVRSGVMLNAPAIVVQSFHQSELDMVKCWKFVRRKSFQRKLSPVSSRSESPLSDRGPNEKYSPLFYPNEDGSFSTDSDEMYDNRNLSSPEPTPNNAAAQRLLTESANAKMQSMKKRKSHRNCSKSKQNFKGAYKRVSCTGSPKKKSNHLRMSVDLDSSADESSASSDEFSAHQANGFVLNNISNNSGQINSDDEVFEELCPLPIVVTDKTDVNTHFDNQMGESDNSHKANGQLNCSINDCEDDESDEEVMVVELTKGR